MFDPILDGEILCHNCDDNGCEFCEDLELDLQLDGDRDWDRDHGQYDQQEYDEY